METITDVLIANIIKDVQDEAEYFQVRLTPGELSAVNTVLFHVYNHFSKLEEDGYKFTPEVDRFIDDLSSGFDKINNPHDVIDNS